MNRRREAMMGYLFAAPWLIGICIFMLYPLIASFYYSFCDYSVLKAPMWVGTANYQELFHDEVFWHATKNTFWYAVMFLPSSLIVSLGLAMLLNTKAKGMTVYRTLFFLPALVPVVPMAILWFWLFNGQHGIVNEAIGPILAKIDFYTPWFHIHPRPEFFLFHVQPSEPNWLGEPTWTKPAVAVLGVWGAGNAMLIYLASLQDVPTSLIEACELDGANGWQKTRNVTLPMISPVILFNLIMGLIGALQVFAVPYVMWPTGSPEQSAYFFTSFLFDNAFRFNKMGYACAMGWLMFVVILGLTLGLLKMSEKRVYYGGS